MKADKSCDWNEEGILCQEKMYYFTRETYYSNKLCSNSVKIYFNDMAGYVFLSYYDIQGNINL